MSLLIGLGLTQNHHFPLQRQVPAGSAYEAKQTQTLIFCDPSVSPVVMSE
ncbi:hypothetical protein [Phormidium nigroviride]